MLNLLLYRLLLPSICQIQSQRCMPFYVWYLKFAGLNIHVAVSQSWQSLSWCVVTNISEEYTAIIFRANPFYSPEGAVG